MITRFKQPVLISIALVIITGCSHYKLGDVSSLPFRTIYVAPAKNSSFAPQAQAILTQQVSDALLRSGLKLAGPNQADVTLNLEITHYERRVSATQADDTALAESFTLVMDATSTLSHNSLDKLYYSNRPHSASQQTYINDGFQASEYQATPALTQQLADDIANSVTSVW